MRASIATSFLRASSAIFGDGEPMVQEEEVEEEAVAVAVVEEEEGLLLIVLLRPASTNENVGSRFKYRNS